MPKVPKAPKAAKAPKAVKAPKVKEEKPPKAPRAKRRAALPKAPATPVPSPAGVEPKTSGEKVETVAALKPLPEFVRPSIPFILGVAILANFQAALTLLESAAAAGDAEAKELAQKINELIDDVHRRTILPSAEKESSSTG